MPWYYKITRNIEVVLDKRIYQLIPLYSHHGRFDVYIQIYNNHTCLQDYCSLLPPNCI